MSAPWAVRLPLASLRALGALRLRRDVLVAEVGDSVWLRGDDLDDELDLQLRKLPGARRYTIDAADALTPFGTRLPTDALPETSSWTPIPTWLAPRPQPAALPGALTHRATLQVERSGTERPAAVLLTTTDAVAAYATTAPAVRLHRLRLAASSDGRAVLWGEPLPPVPGRRYYEERGVAVACGYGFSPAIGHDVVRRLLGLAEGDLALFHADGGYDRVDASNFARATRGTARATRDALRPEGANR